MAHARYRFNPNAIVTRESNCLRSIAKIIPTLLKDAQGNLPFAVEKVSVGYFPRGLVGIQQDGQSYKDSLCIGFTLNQDDFAQAFSALLTETFGEDSNSYLIAGHTPVMGADQNTNSLVVIKHQFVPRFLNEICHAVALYNNHYSMVRDFYCILEGVDNDQFVNNKMINDDIRRSLLETYQKLHMAYHFSARLQTRLPAMAHSANGAHYLAPLFKKFSHGVSSDVEIYERLNALIHGYHLNEKNEIPGFQNRLEDDAERARMVDVYGDDLLTLIHHGDMFYEISEIFKKDGDAKVAYVSPDNLFRCGSAALTGNRGSVEEALVRASDYVPKALQSVALDPRDPQGVLMQLYQHLSPTGAQLRLTSACGIYYLAGQTIPEYVPLAQAKAYSEYAYERLHLAKEMVNGEFPVTCRDYQDRYAMTKQNPHRVDNVSFLDAQGRVRNVSVVGMVGLDGKRAEPGSMAAKLGFDDKPDHDAKGWGNDKKFNMMNVVNFYKDQWIKAFRAVVYAQPAIKTFVLNPVGCGAFDPSSDGATYTRASAQGFAEALVAMRYSLEDAGIQLILPIYDMKKVYPHYKKAIDEMMLMMFKIRPQAVSCIGGTEASCLALIRQKYEAMGGKKFDMKEKSLLEVIAHALTKPRKMRDVLFVLKYLKKDEAGKVTLGDCAPSNVKAAFHEVNNPKHALRVKEDILEEYKHVQGLFHKNKFDVAHASLDDIIKHARDKEGNMQKALINLYAKPSLMGGNDDAVPECVRAGLRPQ